MEGWTETTLATLRSAGYRSGGARRTVVELLGRQDCCLTAQEIFDRLRADGRAVGIASVYRVLDLLGEKGLVQRIDVGAGGSRTRFIKGLMKAIRWVERFSRPRLQFLFDHRASNSIFGLLVILMATG